VSTSRSGIALIVAAYASKPLSSSWDVVLVWFTSTKAGRKEVEDIFQDITVDSPVNPTLFISTVSMCGAGLDTLKHANHGILFNCYSSRWTFGTVWRKTQCGIKTHIAPLVTLLSLGDD
jgi:hypothetical protein